MPANLTPQYIETERKLRSAKTSEEKLAIYKELLMVIPKHKGTEKMQADLKTKISRLTKEIQRKPATKRGIDYFTPREGAGQAVLVGPPNSGKSQLLNSLTNAHSEVADFPYTTRIPVVGMVPFEDVQIQLIDIPSLGDEHIDPWVFGIIRNAEMIILVCDLGSNYVVEDTGLVLEKLKETKIELDTADPNAKVCLLVGNKAELPNAADRIKELAEFYGDRFRFHPISSVTGAGVEEFRRILFESLGIIRVYTKAPGKPIERRDPVILKKGSTVLDAAERIHKDFLQGLKYVKLWNQSLNGLRVEKSHMLEDQDVVEFHV